MSSQNYLYIDITIRLLLSYFLCRYLLANQRSIVGKNKLAEIFIECVNSVGNIIWFFYFNDRFLTERNALISHLYFNAKYNIEFI